MREHHKQAQNQACNPICKSILSQTHYPPQNSAKFKEDVLQDTRFSLAFDLCNWVCMLCFHVIDDDPALIRTLVHVKFHLST